MYQWANQLNLRIRLERNRKIENLTPKRFIYVVVSTLQSIEDKRRGFKGHTLWNTISKTLALCKCEPWLPNILPQNIYHTHTVSQFEMRNHVYKLLLNTTSQILLTSHVFVPICPGFAKITEKSSINDMVHTISIKKLHFLPRQTNDQEMLNF